MVADPQGGEHQGRIIGTAFKISGKKHDETSPPHILASGRRRCRAPGRLADRGCAKLSDTADYDRRAIPCGWADGRDRATLGRAYEDLTRSTCNHGKRVWRSR